VGLSWGESTKPSPKTQHNEDTFDSGPHPPPDPGQLAAGIGGRRTHKDPFAGGVGKIRCPLPLAALGPDDEPNPQTVLTPLDSRCNPIVIEQRRGHFTPLFLKQILGSHRNRSATPRWGRIGAKIRLGTKFHFSHSPSATNQSGEGSEGQTEPVGRERP